MSPLFLYKMYTNIVGPVSTAKQVPHFSYRALEGELHQIATAVWALEKAFHFHFEIIVGSTPKTQWKHLYSSEHYSCLDCCIYSMLDASFQTCRVILHKWKQVPNELALHNKCLRQMHLLTLWHMRFHAGDEKQVQRTSQVFEFVPTTAVCMI